MNVRTKSFSNRVKIESIKTFLFTALEWQKTDFCLHTDAQAGVRGKEKKNWEKTCQP